MGKLVPSEVERKDLIKEHAECLHEGPRHIMEKWSFNETWAEQYMQTEENESTECNTLKWTKNETKFMTTLRFSLLSDAASGFLK